jgi:carbonic anhydrase
MAEGLFVGRFLCCGPRPSVLKCSLVSVLHFYFVRSRLSFTLCTITVEMMNKALLCLLATSLSMAPVAIAAGGGGAAAPTTSEPVEESWPAHHWGYEGSGAPHFWDETEPEKFALCANGKIQSPINFNDPETKSFVTEKARSLVGISWPTAVGNETMKFTNLGHTVQVGPFPTGFNTNYKSQTFKVAQFHFHSPSEHHVGNDFSPLEVHFVHKTDAGALGVIGIMIDIADDNTPSDFLQTLVDLMPSIAAEGESTPVALLNITTLMAEVNSLNSGFYTYDGSLTTPPCTEGVNWMVAKDRLKMSGAQFNAFRKTIRYSTRQTQRRAFGEEIDHYADHSGAAETAAVSAVSVAVAALTQLFL